MHFSICKVEKFNQLIGNIQRVMMKKKLLIAITATLLMSACADKKITTLGQNSGNELYGSSNGSTTNSYGYGSSDNVDPYGNGNYGNQNGNNGYGNGTYGNENGSYLGRANGVENVYFSSNEYTITADNIPTIHNNAQLLKAKITSGSSVRLDGHCDASGSDEYNYALGLRRAKATKDALIMKGMNESSISLVSMGESSPECSNSSSSDCYAKNRRVEFNIVQ